MELDSEQGLLRASSTPHLASAGGGRHGWLKARWFRVAVGLPISAVLLFLTVSRVNLDLLAKAWASVVPIVLLAAALVSVMEVSVRAVRWRILLSPFCETSFGTSLGYLTFGQLANTVLPARLGDVTRALLAGTHLRVSRLSVLGTIAVERVADAGLLSLAIAVGAVVGLAGMGQTLVTLALVFAAGAALLAGSVLLLRRRSLGDSRAGRLILREGGKFLAGARALTRVSSLASVGLLTLGSFCLAIAIFSIVAAAVGLSLPIWQSALVIAAVTLSTAIPAGPASIGPYEFVGMTLMTAMGYPPETSLLCVALVHVVALVPASLMGLVAMWWMGLGWRGAGPQDASPELAS